MKPVYKILIAVVVVVLIGGGIYFAWQNLLSPSTTPEQPSGVNGGQSPTEATAGLKKLSDRPVFDFGIIPETKNIVYLAADGKILEIAGDENSLLSNQTINALNQAMLSPDNRKFLASFGDPRQPQWGIFDLIDKIWRPLPAEIINVTWGENSDTLIGFVRSQNRVDLSSINLAQNPPETTTLIPNLNFYDVRLAWQSPNELLIMEKPSADYAGQIWSLNTGNRELRALLGPELGLTGRWFDKENTLLAFSVSNQFRIITATSVIPFFKTLPDKCVVDGLVYCFAQLDLSSTVKMPDDYFMKKILSVDSLYTINRGNGTINKLTINIESVPAIDAFHPQYLDGKIYFINRYDGFLYELTL